MKDQNDNEAPTLELENLEVAIGNMQCALFDMDEQKTRYLSERLCDLDDAIERFKEQNH